MKISWMKDVTSGIVQAVGTTGLATLLESHENFYARDLPYWTQGRVARRADLGTETSFNTQSRVSFSSRVQDKHSSSLTREESGRYRSTDHFAKFAVRHCIDGRSDALQIIQL